MVAPATIMMATRMAPITEPTMAPTGAPDFWGESLFPWGKALDDEEGEGGEVSGGTVEPPGKKTQEELRKLEYSLDLLLMYTHRHAYSKL